MKKLLAILLVAITLLASCTKRNDLPAPSGVGKYRLNISVFATEHYDYKIDSLNYFVNHNPLFTLDAKYSIRINSKPIFENGYAIIGQNYSAANYYTDSIIASHNVNKGDTITITGYGVSYYPNGSSILLVPYSHLMITYDGVLKCAINTKDTLNYTYIVE